MNDDPVGFFPDFHVAIVGLGLMGGSLAMALRDKCAGILAVDPDPETRALARELGIVDQVLPKADKNLAAADVVILAAPVRAIIRLIRELPELHPGAPLVLDLGSTKSEVLSAMDALPARFDPIGGHPMCGKARGSLRNAEAALYRGATFALAPLPRSSDRAKKIAVELVEAIGAKTFWLEPGIHDYWVGMTSHLPFLVANTLAGVAPAGSAPLVGPGFRSTTRLAPTPPDVMLDILATNRENVLAGIQRFQERLAELESKLADRDDEGLRRLLDAGARRYDELIGH